MQMIETFYKVKCEEKLFCMCESGGGKCGLGGNKKLPMPTNLKLIENTFYIATKVGVGK